MRNMMMKNLRSICLILFVLATGCVYNIFSQTTGEATEDRARELVNDTLDKTTRTPVPPRPDKTKKPKKPHKTSTPMPSAKTSVTPLPMATATFQSSASENEKTWSEEMYAVYDYMSFEKSPIANQRIDFANIDYPLLHAAIFFETNRQRVIFGKKQFLHSPCLEQAAKSHSDDMVKHNFFSHTSVVKGRQSLKQRLALAGIVNSRGGENIADTFGLEYTAGASVYTPEQNGGYFSYTYRGKRIENHTYIGYAKSVLETWMNSPGHKANILDTSFIYLGAGAAHHRLKSFSNMDYFKATQNFSDIKGSCND